MPNPRLYNEAFTGRAKATACRTTTCLRTVHTTHTGQCLGSFLTRQSGSHSNSPALQPTMPTQGRVRRKSVAGITSAGNQCSTCPGQHTLGEETWGRGERGGHSVGEEKEDHERGEGEWNGHPRSAQDDLRLRAKIPPPPPRPAACSPPAPELS